MWNQSVSYTRIKLCWFDYLEAAYEASVMGVDMLGFHIFEEEDDWKQQSDIFQEMMKYLPLNVSKVLLTDMNIEQTISIMRKVNFDTIQLYPDWPISKINELRCSVDRKIKVLKLFSAVGEENAIVNHFEYLDFYSGAVDGFLLDSRRKGGTGETADWDKCAQIVHKSKLPMFLAGGINVSNVEHAIKKVRPFGLDIESGVSYKINEELMLKSIQKCKEFIEKVTRVDRDILRLEASL